jgi:hypothetical protein
MPLRVNALEYGIGQVPQRPFAVVEHGEHRLLVRRLHDSQDGEDGVVLHAEGRPLVPTPAAVTVKP